MVKPQDFNNKRESKQKDKFKDCITWTSTQRFGHSDNSPMRKKSAKKNSIDTPMTQTTWCNSVQKQTNYKIPLSALNVYKKYLSVQNESKYKNPSVSINEISKTLSIDTFNTEWNQKSLQ